MGAPRRNIDLYGLACQLSQLADKVREECGHGSHEGAPVTPQPVPPEVFRESDDNADLVTIAKAWAHASAARDATFETGLFADPAWNMLLDLYIHRAKRCPVAVSSLSIAAGTPATTALRWITLLEGRGLVSRHPDKFDRRRCFIELTNLAVERIETALQRARESDRKLGLGRLEGFN